MPLTRYQIRSEHTLADPELYRAADKDDPEALLEGVAMAGLVGVLRQLGDLAEFAAEIFHDLHEEVMTTATRGNGLMTRVQQLEADFPSIEKAILSQTDHSVLFHNKGVDWHPNQRMDQNLVTGTDLPRFVMDSYEECRGPPRLFLLDKFDTAGAGACLKRYTDPSFFKAETLSSGLKKSELQRDKKIRKTKKKPSRWRNGATPEVVPASHSKLHQLLLEERVQNGTNDPARHIKLKKRQLPGSSFDLKNGKSYMEKFFEISSPEKKDINEIAGGAPPLEPIDDNTCDSVQEIVEISTIFPNKKQLRRKRISFSSPYTQESDHNVPMDDLAEAASVTEAMEAELAAGVDKFTAQDVVFEKDFTLLGDSKKAGSIDGYHSDDVTSEVDNFVDALPTMESEIDPESECSSKHNLTSSCVEKHGTDSDANEEHDVVQHQFSDSQSIGNSTFDDSSGKERYSHSDTLSSFAENIAPDFDGTVPCTNSVAEDSGSLNQPPLSEVNSTESLELVKFNFTNVEDVAAIPRYRSDQGEASCSSCLTDFDPGILHLNHGGTLEEVSSDHNLIDINKNGENLDAMLVTSHVSLITSKTNEVLIHPLDEHINADDMSNSQHILQQKTNVSSEVCQVKHVDVTDKFVNGSSLTDLHTEGQLQTLPSPNRETCLEMESKFPDRLAGRIVSDPFVAEPNSMDSEVDMALLGRSNSGSLAPLEDHNTSSTSEASLHPENLFASVNTEADIVSREYMEHTATAEDTRQCAPYSEQHLSQFRHDFSQIELNTSEATSGIEANRECLPSSSLDQENGLSTVNVDRLKNNDFPLLDTFDNPSDFVQDYASDTVKVIANAPSSIHDDGLGNSGGPLEKPFHYPSDSVLQNNASDTVKEAAAIAQSSSHDEFGDVANDVAFPSDLVSSPPWNSRNSQDLFDSGEYPNDDLESDACRSSVSLSECKTQREVMQLGVAANSSFSSSSGTSDDNLNFEDEDTADPAMTEEMVPLEHVDQVVESSPTRTNSQLVTDIKHYPLESNLELQWDQPDLDYLQEYKLNDQLQHVHPLVHLDQENCIGVHLNDFPEQSPASHMLVQSAGQKPEGFEHLTNGSETIFPSFHPLPEASQVNLEEAPPLPPLPPVQWRRLAKLLQAQNRLEHETESHGLGSHSQLFSSKIDDEHASVGLSSPGGEASKSQNLDLPSSSLQEEEEVKPNHVFGYSVERSVLSSGITLQMPIMVNNDDGQHDIHRLEESERLNEMSPSTKSLQNGFQLSEGETVQSLSPEAQLSEGGSPEHYPSSSQGKPIEHLRREESHMGLQDTRHHDTFQSSERDILNPPEKVSPLPTTEAGQSQDSQQVPTTEVGQSQEPPQAPITEAEQNQEPLHTPITEAVNSLDSQQLPTTDSGQSLDSQQALQSTDLETEHSIESPLPHVPEQPNEKPLPKIPRPRDPLIEAVAAHDKSKLKKVAERVVRAQVEEKADNRDSLLEQIRAKSFSLKPAAMTRPSIQGPKTNLKVAAILEKANAIRQALAGSDEDDDADSWSSDS